MKQFLICIVVVVMCALPIAAQNYSLSVDEPVVPDTVGWITALKQGKLDFNDSTIRYPRAMRAGYNSLQWYNRTFNNYDTAYVGSVDKLWRITVKNENWIDDYDCRPFPNTLFSFHSGVTSILGAYLSVAGISLGYSADVDLFFRNKPTSKKLEFSINCALFTAEYWRTTNRGKMYLKLRDEEEKETYRYKDFEGLFRRSWGLNVYYFFNHRQYAQAAAYSFSKIQLRDAGSPLVGFNITHQNFSFRPGLINNWDDMALWDDMEEETLFDYTDYCLSGGYAYNWVLGNNWLLNGTALVHAGVKHAHSASTSDGGGNFFSLNSKLRACALYRTHGFFISAQGYLDTRFFNTGRYHFRSFLIDFALVTGVSF